MGDYKGMLQNQQGLVVRQRLRLKNLFACCMRNEYDIAAFPAGQDANEPWEDPVFRTAVSNPLGYGHEDSDLMCKLCCNNFRAFKMNVFTGNSTDGAVLMNFDRPFKCPVICCCMVPWPQEITTYAGAGESAKIGMVKQDWRCIPAVCGKTYFKVYDATDQPKYVVEHDVCCNANCFAPSCICKVRKLDIKDAADETRVVGSIENIFPGCTFRSLCCGNLIDNYRLTFPTDASPEDKANLLAALMLVDFMLFSNAGNDE